jgi:hypothetical protein
MVPSVVREDRFIRCFLFACCLLSIILCNLRMLILPVQIAPSIFQGIHFSTTSRFCTVQGTSYTVKIVASMTTYDVQRSPSPCSTPSNLHPRSSEPNIVSPELNLSNLSATTSTRSPFLRMEGSEICLVSNDGEVGKVSRGIEYDYC